MDKTFSNGLNSLGCSFVAKKKEDYLVGEIPIPKKDDPCYKKWKARNHQIMSRLTNSMNVDIGKNFLLYETAHEIWEAVRETYSSSENTSEFFVIESVLHDLW